MADRLPAPWTIRQPTGECFIVVDATGQPVAYVYFRATALVGTDRTGRLSRDLARRVAANIARLPVLLAKPGP